jgi:shikimate kinase
VADSLICLCGFMGSGKTTVGTRLAAKLKYRFVDLDSEIERQEGRSIAKIFETDGESYFRAMEVLIGSPLFESRDLVLAVGGGALTNPELLQLALQRSFLVYLEVADAWTLYDRLRGQLDRPLLKGVETYEAFEGVYRRLMSRRRPDFERARLTLTTDQLAPDDIVERIVARLPKVARHANR